MSIIIVNYNREMGETNDIVGRGYFSVSHCASHILLIVSNLPHYSHVRVDVSCIDLDSTIIATSLWDLYQSSSLGALFVLISLTCY